MKEKREKMRRKTHLLLMIFALLGCAKERPYEEAFKEKPVLSKASAPSGDNTDYLYSMQSQGVPGFTKGVAPFVQGQEKIVRVRWKEEGLEIYRPYGNEDFDSSIRSDKERNRTELDENIILTIPVDYVSYHCKKNADDQCTNEEEENKDLTWDQKDSFVPKYEEIELHDVDPNIETLDSDKCYSKVKTEVTHKELAKDTINIELQHTYEYSKSESCFYSAWYRSGGSWSEFQNFFNENSSFKTREFFSIVKLDNLVSKDYEPVEYPVYDQSLFGFFKTENKVKNVDTTTYRKSLVNRWNPNKKITYYLSQNFSKPENKYLLEATQGAINRMNDLFAKNKIKVQIDLKGPSDVKSGDLKVSVINLIEELSSRLLGYGPSITNPRTGEIVAAHTNMYKGSLESIAKRSYDSLRDFLISKKQTQKIQKVESETSLSLASLSSTSTDQQDSNSEAGKTSNKMMSLNKNDIEDISKKTYFLDQPNNSGLLSNLEKSILTKLKKARDEEVITGKNEISLQRTIDQFESMHSELKELNAKNYYTTDLVSPQELGKASLPELTKKVKGILDADGILKEWRYLTKEQQTLARQILVKNAYVPTLVHELGHNFGLRHNFKGSTDVVNFYHNNIDPNAPHFGDRQPHYSSIMDYGYSDLNELTTFGYYDLAALRYGYNREVELISKKTSDEIDELESKGNINIKTRVRFEGSKIESLKQDNGIVVSLRDLKHNQGAILRPFKYCTDEDAGTSIECRRFDEGTNILEIAKNYIERYKNRYSRANVKGDFSNINEDDHYIYYIWTYRSLVTLRSIHEQWQSIYKYFVDIYGDIDGVRDLMAFGEDESNFLGRVIKANNLVGELFLDIIKTPALTCHFDQVVIGYNNKEIKFNDQFVLLEEALEDSRKTIKLPNEQGETVPTSCDSKAAQDIAKNYIAMKICKEYGMNCAQETLPVSLISANYKGQSGKIFNDINEKEKRYERNETGDLEVIGYWQDKLVATEFLLTPTRMALAGGTDLYISFFNHPYFQKEIQNLTNHLAYGARLESPQDFINEEGIPYRPVYAQNLDNTINIPSYGKYFLSYFVDLGSNETQSFGRSFLRLAAKSNYLSWSNNFANDNVFRAMDAHKNFSVYKWVENKNNTWHSPGPDAINLYQMELFAKETGDSELDRLNEMIRQQRIAVDTKTKTAFKIAYKMVMRDKILKEIDEVANPQQNKQEEIAGLLAPFIESLASNEQSGKKEADNSSEDQSAPQEQEKAISAEAISTVKLAINLKKALAIYGPELSLLNQEDKPSEDQLTFLESNMGKIAMSEMISLMQQLQSNNVPQEVIKLLEFDLEDLEYYIGSPEEKIEQEKRLRRSLLKLPSVGTN